MTRCVNILDAKTRLSQLIRSVQSGEEVVIANRGEPVARLVPIAQRSPDFAERGTAAAVLGWLAGHPPPPYGRRSAEEIEAAIAEQRASWD